MIIIIDGYNLLKQLFPHVKGRLERERDVFIQQLGHYKHKKAGAIKDIITVFDAGMFGHATREIKYGVVVMFSGQNSTADDWIIEYVEEHRNDEILVVTNDRKIVTDCQKYGATVISCNDFYQILQNVLFQPTQPEEVGTGHSCSAKKLQSSEYFCNDVDELSGTDQKMLDMLMEQFSCEINKNENSEQVVPKSVLPKAKSMSKAEKKFYSKVKKLI